jgi:hypothetical protein
LWCFPYHGEKYFYYCEDWGIISGEQNEDQSISQIVTKCEKQGYKISTVSTGYILLTNDNKTKFNQKCSLDIDEISENPDQYNGSIHYVKLYQKNEVI